MNDDHQQDCQNFWCAAYLAAVSAGYVESADGAADKALLDYDSRFAPVEEPLPEIKSPAEEPYPFIGPAVIDPDPLDLLG